jgi:replication-associated recombination protein RarA
MNLLTKEHGYPLSEAISALQKEIRRGNEEAAMYWALELENGYPQYLWHRLEVIVNEDIGPAAPEVIVLVHTLKQQYMEMIARPGQASELLCLANAILAMCRSEKSRLADNFMTVVQQERAQNGLKLEVPDYALDKHTLKGKQKGRGWEFFNKVSSFIENKTDKFKDIYKARADLLRLTYQNVERFKAGSIDNRKLGKKTAAKQTLTEDSKAPDDAKLPL